MLGTLKAILHTSLAFSSGKGQYMHGMNKIRRRLVYLHDSATLYIFDIKRLLLLAVNVALSHSRMAPLPTFGGTSDVESCHIIHFQK